MHLLAHHSEYSRRNDKTGVIAYMGNLKLTEFESQKSARLGKKTIQALNAARISSALILVRGGEMDNDETVISYELLPGSHEVLNFSSAASRRRELCMLIVRLLAEHDFRIIDFVDVAVRA